MKVNTDIASVVSFLLVSGSYFFIVFDLLSD